MNLIFFQPAAQVINTGDILINRALLSLLRRHGKVVFNDIGRPKWFVDECVESGDLLLSRLGERSMSKAIDRHLSLSRKTKDKIFLFFPPGHTSRKGFKRAWLHLKQTMALAYLRFRGCSIIRVGFSIGPFDFSNSLIESLSTWVYKVYGLREQNSLNLARRFLFRSVQYFPDLAWAFHVENEDTLSEVDHEHVVLSFRSNVYGTVHDPSYLEHTNEQLKNALLAVFSVDQPIQVVYQVGSDRDAMLDLTSYLSRYFNQVDFIDKCLSVKEAGEIYKSSMLVVSNRLHVLLYAILYHKQGIAVINPNDNKKITGIFHQNRLGRNLLDINSSKDVFVENFRYLVENRHQQKAEFSRIKVENMNRIAMEIDKIFA